MKQFHKCDENCTRNIETENILDIHSLELIDASKYIEFNKTLKEKYGEDLIDLVDCSFGVTCNANDFFAYACADAVTIDSSDLIWVLPIIKKYKQDGLNACMSYIAGIKPLQHYITSEFKKASKDITKIIKENDYIVFSQY